jgi:hypothetical protein
MNTIPLSDKISKKTFTERKKWKVKHLFLSLLLLSVLQMSSCSVYWMNDDSDLQVLTSPYEVLKRLDLQHGVNLRDDKLEKSVLKLGLKYVEDEPIYVIVLRMKTSNQKKMYYGAEYRPLKDGLIADEGNQRFWNIK